MLIAVMTFTCSLLSSTIWHLPPFLVYRFMYRPATRWNPKVSHIGHSWTDIAINYRRGLHRMHCWHKLQWFIVCLCLCGTYARLSWVVENVFYPWVTLFQPHLDHCWSVVRVVTSNGIIWTSKGRSKLWFRLWVMYCKEIFCQSS